MPEESTPILQVTKGDPTPEELAALIAVVAARTSSASASASGGSTSSDEERSSDWASYWRNVRRPLQHGPGRWRASAHP